MSFSIKRTHVLITANLMLAILGFRVYQKNQGIDVIKKQEKLISDIRNSEFENIGPLKWEIVKKNCISLNHKRHWTLFKRLNISANAVQLVNLEKTNSWNMFYFTKDYEFPASGYIPRSMIKLVLAPQFEYQPMFTSWKTVIRHRLYRDFCFHVLDEVRVATLTELKQFNEL